MGFDPGSPGSRPGPKAGAKPLRHPGIPKRSILKGKVRVLLKRPNEKQSKKYLGKCKTLTRSISIKDPM